VVSSGCSCPSGTFDSLTCADAAAFDAAATADTGTPVDTGVSVDTGTPLDSERVLDSGGDECTMNSGCGLRPASCCGSCGAATAGDYLAAPVSQLATIGAQICEAAGNPGCPECARPNDPFLAALCRAGDCVGLDLREEPLTECTVPSDCVLAPRECWSCGLIDQPAAIAYNPARGSINDYVCDTGRTCDEPCVPTFASGLAASCVSGRCVVFGPD
jgi:hypothetical protein